MVGLIVKINIEINPKMNNKMVLAFEKVNAELFFFSLNCFFNIMVSCWITFF